MFQTDASIKELAARNKTASQETLDKVQEMRRWDPQLLTGCWVDRNGVMLAVYFSRGDRPQHQPKKEGEETNQVDKEKAKARDESHTSHVPKLML